MSYYPYMAHIKPSDVPYASSGTWILSASSIKLGGLQFEAQTQNAYVEWSVYLSAGTYRLTVIYERGSNRGIQTWAIDGTSVATIDGYGPQTQNVVSQTSGIVLTAGNHLVRVTTATKNASSTGYFCTLQHISLLRTGD